MPNRGSVPWKAAGTGFINPLNLELTSRYEFSCSPSSIYLSNTSLSTKAPALSEKLTTVYKQRAHRKSLLYDEIHRGLFWEIGKRKNPDNDGRFRPIVVTRGYFEPDNKRRPGDDRQPPENWESYVNPTAAKDIKPRIVQQVVAAPAPAPALAPRSAVVIPRYDAHPRAGLVSQLSSKPAASAAALPDAQRSTPSTGPVVRHTGNCSHEAIDISSDEEDVKPSLADLERDSHSAASGPQSADAQRKTQDSAGNKAETEEAPFQDDTFQLDDTIEPVHDRSLSTRGPANLQAPENNLRTLEYRSQSESLDIWIYIIQFAKTATPYADDAAIAELLELPRRRDLPHRWQRRLGNFITLNLDQLTAVIWYLGGDAYLPSPCKPFECHKYLKDDGVYCTDPGHNAGGCRKCSSAFPECVYLPRYLQLSQAIAKRAETYFCCNAYYRSIFIEQPKGVLRPSYADEIAAIKAKAVRNTLRESNTPANNLSNALLTNESAYSPLQPSTFRANQSIPHSKPKATPQQPAQLSSDSSQRISETSRVPDNRPGHKPALLETLTKDKTSNDTPSRNERAKVRDEGKSSTIRAKDIVRQLRESNGTHQSSVQHSKNPPVLTMPVQEANSSVPEIWMYMLAFLQPGTQIPDDEAVTELLTLRKRRDLTPSWKFRLAAYTKHDLKTFTSVILYLGGDEADTRPCTVMGCAHDHGAAEYAASLQRNGPGHYNRVFVKYAFPKCVFLPRHLASSVAIARRLGNHTCANSYYRKPSLDDKIQSARDHALEARDRIMKTNPGSHAARPSPAPAPQIIPPVASTTKSRPKEEISKNKPKTAPQQTPGGLITNSRSKEDISNSNPKTARKQRNDKASSQKSSGTNSRSKEDISNSKPKTAPKQDSKVSSKGSSGTFHIPEGTPGQMFSLKGTDTKIIQASRNQTLECKVLAGSGVKVTIIGGKEIKAFPDHWNNNWELAPDCQCLVKNIYPDRSFGENATCVDVNPKKGGVKTGQSQVAPLKGKWDYL